MRTTDSTTESRAASPGPIIPFPDLDTTGDSLSESLTRCTSLQSPPETVVSTPVSASFPSSHHLSPLAAAPSTSTTTTTTSTPSYSPVQSSFSPPSGAGAGGQETTATTTTTTINRRRERRETFGRRLKIRSGVNLQVQDLKLRQYTDYDTRTGTPRSPFFSPGIWTGNTFGERDATSLPFAADQTSPFSNLLLQSNSSNLSGLNEYGAVEEVGPLSNSSPPLPILDVFAIKTVHGALNEPGVMARMRHFAESRGRARDIDFLLKVEEYATAVKTVETLLAGASLKLTNMLSSTPTAPASVKLPLRTTRTLSADTRDATTTLLPRLDGMFDDAKAVVEQGLAQDLYPGFLQSQLSLGLQTIGPGYSPNQVCPGFGEAFCMTYPHDADNPIVYASDGLAGLTGYAVQDIVNKNCRFMQGPAVGAWASSGVDRLRGAMRAGHKEFSELVLNFKKDGRPFWNLVFVALLLGLDGEVAYQLGGQIDVTEMLETQEDVACVLSYVPPLVDSAGPPQQASSEDDPSGDRRPDVAPASRHSSTMSSSRGRRVRGETVERSESALSKYPPNASRNKFFRSFLRRYSSASNHNSSNNVAHDNATTDTPSPPPGQVDHHSASSTPTVPTYKFFPVPTAQPFAHQAVVSPYSRFIVLEYLAPPASRSGGSSTHSGYFESSSSSSSHKKSSSRHVQLTVAFCSPAALESLGQGVRSLADVVGTNIFEVLSDKANSPSVTKSFKSMVRGSLAEGRNAKLDLTLNGSSGGGGGGGRARTATRGTSSSRRNNSRPGGGGAENTSLPPPGRSIRKSISLERLVSRRNSVQCGADYVSYWTPLRDDLGNTQYVVMILVPEVS